ncbi:glucokinase [Hyphomicrobium sp.]
MSALEAKGRLRSFLPVIPTYVVVHPWVGLLGASKALDRA